MYIEAEVIEMTTSIQEVLQTLKEPAGNVATGVDILCCGELDTPVSGIATAFIASQYVIEKACTLGVNLLITHEGLFYSHFGNKELSEEDPVIVEKQRVMKESGLAIFRCHDYIHRYQPDGIMIGLLQDLEWLGSVKEHLPYASILDFSSNRTLLEIANDVKQHLNIPYVRIVGDTDMPIRRIGLLVGNRGGGEQAIPLYERDNLDLIIYGEGPEWETPEYVRDAVFQKRNKALMVLGHAESEGSGMKYMANWIQKQYPTIPVHFIPEKPIFQVL